MGHCRSARPLALIATFIALFAAAPVFGSTIVSINGDGSFFESGDSDEWGAQAWTQTASYTDVTIKGMFGYGYYQGTGSAFLEEEVGNHAIEIASADFVFPQDPTEITLFTDLSLGPGTYCLATFGQGSWISDPIEDNPTITAASDVSDVTDTLVSLNHGHTFVDSNNGIYQEFRVTGTEVRVNDTPEPSTALMLGGALMSGVVIRRSAGRI